MLGNVNFSRWEELAERQVVRNPATSIAFLVDAPPPRSMETTRCNGFFLSFSFIFDGPTTEAD